MHNPDELRPRGAADYDGHPIDRALTPDARLSAALGVMYDDAVASAAIALASGRSVLVRADSTLIRPFADAVAARDGISRSARFHESSLEHAEAGRGFQFHDRVELYPARQLLTGSFQRFLSSEAADERVALVDFLDAFCTHAGDPSDLITVLSAHRDRPLLGFALSETPLPPAVRTRFDLELTLPPPDRSQVWALLRYRELKAVFSATTLSVGLQVTLHHLAANIDVGRFRAAVERLVEETGTLPGFEAVAALRSLIAPRHSILPTDPPPGPAASVLAAAVVEPFRSYRVAQNASEVDSLDRRLAHGVRLYGDVGEAAAVAAWLAAELEASYLVADGARLVEGAAALTRNPDMPIVFFVREFDDVLLDPRGRSALLAALVRFNRTHPVILLAHLVEPTPLPAQLARRLPLELHLS